MWMILFSLVVTVCLISKEIRKQGYISIKSFKKNVVYYLFVYYIYLALSSLYLPFEITVWIVFLLLPFVVLTVYKIREQREIENGMINFLQLLNSRLVIDEDMITSIESITENVTSKAIKRILREFIVIFKVSCNPELAFETMQKVNHGYLRYVFLNIQGVLNSWGDPVHLIQELENEYISVYTELNKGKSELQNDKLMTYFGLLLAGMTAFNVVSNHPMMIQYYSSRPMLAAVLSVLGLIGVTVLVLSKIGE